MDALRGIAALAVVEFHFNGISAHFFRHGYLAVDFFFLLSGFVLSHAYQQRLDNDWPLGRFLKVRFIRLWPLSTLGLVMGFVLALAGHSRIKVPISIRESWLFAGLNLFFIPVDLRSPGFMMFPFNPACWSLFFELIANLLHALLFRRVRSGMLVGVCVLSGAVLAWRVHIMGSANIGLNADKIDGYARVMFSYTLGMLLFRLWRQSPTARHVSSMSVIVALMLLLAVPALKTTAWYDIICILLLLPLLVYFSGYAFHGERYEKVLQALGRASYGIYVLQFPVVLLLRWILPPGLHRPFLGLILYPLLISSALVADFYIDTPMRSKLRAWSNA